MAGGRGAAGWSLLSTTEVLAYSEASPSWREAASLPGGRYGPRGATLAGVFHVTGGSDGQRRDEIYAYIPESQTWTLAGTMDGARYRHAVTVVNLTTELCLP